MKRITQLSIQTWGRVAPYLKQATPLLVVGAFAALRCEAAASPFAKLVTDAANEATGTWAVAGAGIGLVTGIVGLKMDGGQNHKGPLFTLIGLSFGLLSVNAIVAYLQNE